MFFFLNVRFNFYYKKHTFLNRKIFMQYYFYPSSLCELILFLKFLPNSCKIYWLGLSEYSLFRHKDCFKFFICTSKLFKEINISFYYNNYILKIGGFVDYLFLLRFCIENDINIVNFAPYYCRTLYEYFIFKRKKFFFNFKNLIKIYAISRFGKVFIFTFSDIINYHNFFKNNDLYIIFFIFHLKKSRINLDFFSYKNIFSFSGYEYIHISVNNFVNYYNYFLLFKNYSEYSNISFNFYKNCLGFILNFEAKDFNNITFFLDYISCKGKESFNVLFKYNLF